MTDATLELHPALFEKLAKRFDRFVCMTCSEDRDLKHGTRRSLGAHIDVFQCYTCVAALGDLEMKAFLRAHLDDPVDKDVEVQAAKIAKNFMAWREKQSQPPLG